MMTRHWRLITAVIIAAAILLSVLLFNGSNGIGEIRTDDVKVGLLHSKTGVMAMSELPVLDAEKLAIAEINSMGGILGHHITVVEEDGASSPAQFVGAVKKMLDEDKVNVIFGCWTSSSRKAIKPFIEKANALLMYPVQYEGLEEGKSNIIYMGSTLNQQIIPAVEYLLSNGKRRMYLIGSDYVFPRTANSVIKAQLKAMGGEFAGEEYIPLGGGNFDAVVQKIKATNPQVIINTLNGSSNVAFFAALKKNGINAEQIPVMSFSIAETEIAAIGAANAAGHLVCWSYFETLKSDENHHFVENYKKTYGANRVTSDPIEAAYNAVYLWKTAVEKAGGFEIDGIRAALRGLDIPSPEGMIVVDEDTMHLYKRARIGRINTDGRIEQIAASDVIKPDPQLANVPWVHDIKP